MSDALAPGWRATTCPRCGGPFACGVGADRDAPCFCANVRLSDARRAELSAKWSDCLCAACLAALSADPELAA